MSHIEIICAGDWTFISGYKENGALLRWPENPIGTSNAIIETVGFEFSFLPREVAFERIFCIHPIISTTKKKQRLKVIGHCFKS
jgi:hypothetical protein